MDDCKTDENDVANHNRNTETAGIDCSRAVNCLGLNSCDERYGEKTP